MSKIYLDYAATTPVDPAVAKAMKPYFAKIFGNSMSLHSFGQEAKRALEESRAKLALIINAKPNEIIFTGSATESNNLALKGLALAGQPAFAKATARRGHIIISSIEHPCILESAKWLEKQGFSASGGPAEGWEITKIPVDKFGMANPKDIEKAIKPETILVSIIHASNEIGTIQPIAEIGKICREKKVYFHTDASQSFGKVPIDVKKMNIDFLTASSHKIYGPKGAGFLYVREGIKLVPLLHGGGQENGLRGSTVNVPAIVGFAKAAEICQKEMEKENERLIKLRNKLIKEILKIKNSHLNGPPCGEAGHPEKRLANNANFWFKFVEGESLVMQLDLEGIACSTGSACSSFKLEPSHVLLATGLKPQEAHGSLRVSLGRFTTEKEIDKLIAVLPGIIEKIRKISPFK